jgi:hypothetical protein
MMMFSLIGGVCGYVSIHFSDFASLERGLVFGVWSVFPIYPSIAFELVVMVVQLHVANPIMNLILSLCHV